MKPRNREITIFNVSMLDVISGAVGAFLILMIVLFPSYQKTHGETDKEVEQENQELRGELARLEENARRLNEERLKKTKQKLEQEKRNVEQEIARVKRKNQQQKKKTRGSTNRESKGLGLLTLFARWEKPLNVRGADVFQVFLVPGAMSLSTLDRPRLREDFCRTLLQRNGLKELRHLTAEYARKSGVIVQRVKRDIYGILYCWKGGRKDEDMGRRVKVSGHVNYGLKIRPLPEVYVKVGGTNGGLVSLDGERIKITTPEEMLEKRRIRQKGRKSGKSSLMRGLEELMTPKRKTK